MKYETKIIWLEDTGHLDYVREARYLASSRQRGFASRLNATLPGRVVGYAVLSKDAPADMPSTFNRRYFWLAEHDRANDPEGTYKTGCPSEGVDPRTVKPGVAGEITDRAWNGL